MRSLQLRTPVRKQKPKMDVQPKDPSKRHFYFSMAKSVLRIVAGISLIQGSIVDAGIYLIAAEALGIAEEF